MAAMDDTAPAESNEQEDFGYRRDLRHAVGIMVTTPYHSTDESGRIRWGSLDGAMQTDEDFTSQFQAEMERIFSDAVDKHLGSKSPPRRKKFSHQYFQPPAAQGWPEVAIWLWDNALPALGAFDVLIATGKTIRDIKSHIHEWFQSKSIELQLEYQGSDSADVSQRVAEAFNPQIQLTPMDIAALMSLDAYERLGVRDVTRVTVYTRSPSGMGGPRPHEFIPNLDRRRSQKLGVCCRFIR